MKMQTATNKYLFFLLFMFAPGMAQIFSQTWTQKNNIPASGRFNAVGFSIGTKGYIGTGSSAAAGPFYNDFWEWDQATNVWTQRADFAGGPRAYAVGFSIGAKGYIGTGYNGMEQKDFWEWDGNPSSPTFNQWKQKTDFGGLRRSWAVGLSIGTRGYIGTGFASPNSYYSDFWEYDQASDTWTKRANYPGTGLFAPVGFSIGTKAYVGVGSSNGSDRASNDFWEWNQPTDTWTPKANFPGAGRYLAAGFSIGTKGFIGTGFDKNNNSLSDFWEYDQRTNTWIKRADYGAGSVHDAVGFSIGNKGYIGTGTGNYDKSNPANDLWEYSDPTQTVSCTLPASVASDPSSVCAGGTVGLVASGGTRYLWNTGATTAYIQDTPNVTTTYSVTVTNNAGCTGVASITVGVLNCATGISENNLSASQVVVSPNPFNESAVVAISGVEGIQSHELKIFDMLGNEVRSISFTGIETTLQRGDLSDGIYFYKLVRKESFGDTPLSLGRGAGGEVTGKFIISK